MRKNNFKLAFRDVRGKLRSMAANKELPPVACFNGSMGLLNDFLRDLREQVVSVAFTDKFEEIYFFKFEKPEFYSVKIFYQLQYTLLDQTPAGPATVIKAYYLEELRFIARFFKQHAFHYEYFRSGFTELDHLLFLRGVSVQSVLLPGVAEMNDGFSTGGDALFAQFMAYEELQEFIIARLKALDEVPSAVAAGIGKKRFDWTGEVINLVELGYGLYLSGQIGNGKAGLQEIFNWLEESFGVEIGIPANRFREIKRRKRLSRTHLTDLIRDALIAYMEADNEL